jgi:lipopolysaccharide/colanic/teichoic acid biosynthesis glycosyltransferase
MSAATVASVRERAIPPIALPHQLTVAGAVLPRTRAQRLLDIAGSATMLLLLVPALLMIALMIAATSRGGVLYRQTRVGVGGTTFTCLKFRTMHAGGHQKRADLVHLDEGNGLLFKIRRDPRVTPVGRVLRRLSLDELPQLVNVLRGEMALVGPRPALPEEVARYTGLERERLRTTPGITGLWQVSGRSDLSWEQSVALDLHYVRSASLRLDLAILLRTVTAVLSGRGAY